MSGIDDGAKWAIGFLIVGMTIAWWYEYYRGIWLVRTVMGVSGGALLALGTLNLSYVAGAKSQYYADSKIALIHAVDVTKKLDAMVKNSEDTFAGNKKLLEAMKDLIEFRRTEGEFPLVTDRPISDTVINLLFVLTAYALVLSFLVPPPVRRGMRKPADDSASEHRAK